MSKNITLNIDDTAYHIFKMAAESQKRELANFIEFAAFQYLSSEAYVDEDEMSEILKDTQLVQSLRAGLDEIKQGAFDFI